MLNTYSIKEQVKRDRVFPTSQLVKSMSIPIADFNFIEEVVPRSKFSTSRGKSGHRDRKASE